MRIHAVQPTGRERHFGIDEMFFSTTDPRGVIRAGNAVFTRLSGYDRHELIGSPHNLIRHPLMPRVVFRSLWQTIKAGQAFTGYVVNQAKNGDHYWVYVVVVPTADGFVSVRFKPTTTLLARVDQLYRELVAHENAAVEAGATESQAADAAAEPLAAAVREAGFPDYAAFGQAALNQEIKARDALLEQRHLRLFPADLGELRHPAAPALRVLYRHSRSLYETLHRLFGILDTFTTHTSGIREKTAQVLARAEGFRLSALNAHISAEPLAQAGVTLGTIATFLNGYSQTLGGNVTSLAGGIRETITAAEEVAAHLSVGRLLLEMTLRFQSEVARADGTDPQAGEKVALLNEIAEASSTALGQVAAAFARLHAQLPRLKKDSAELRKDVLSLQVAQMSGLVEASRIVGADVIRTMFAGFRGEIDQAHQGLGELIDVVGTLAQLTRTVPAAVHALREGNHGLRATLAELTT